MFCNLNLNELKLNKIEKVVAQLQWLHFKSSIATRDQQLQYCTTQSGNTSGSMHTEGKFEETEAHVEKMNFSRLPSKRVIQPQLELCVCWGGAYDISSL